MTTIHRTPPESASLHPSGFFPLDATWEITRLPLADRRYRLPSGEPLFARLDYHSAVSWCQIHGCELPTAAQLEQARIAGLTIRPAVQPIAADLATAERHDALVWGWLAAAGWAHGVPVSGAGKHWVRGAPWGRSWLMGWHVERVEAYGSKSRTGPGWVQSAPAAGSNGPHDDRHVDFSSTTLVVRRRAPVEDVDPDGDTEPPGWAAAAERAALDALRPTAVAVREAVGRLLDEDATGGGHVLPSTAGGEPAGHVLPGSPRELPDRLTPGTPGEVYAALAGAWLASLGTAPRRTSLLILCAQWALETGWGKSCHGWNLGNVKGKPDGSDGRSWAFFACNEILPTSQALGYVAKAGERRDGGGPSAAITRTSEGTSTVWFYPPHPGCCFRAFATLDEGAADYLALLHKRFATAWAAVEAGDPAAFGHALKLRGYYTADEAEYTRSLVSIVKTMDGRVPA